MGRPASLHRAQARTSLLKAVGLRGTPLESCPLCDTTRHPAFHVSPRGTFFRCATCSLVYLDPAQWPSLDSEIARYELHDHADDAGHAAFLTQLATPVIAHTAVGARGLDYGSGDSDALAALLTRSGRPTVAYDPVFRPGAGVLQARYHFIVCAEVLEHVHQPGALFERFGQLLRPGGIVAIMTGMYDAVPSFADWWYIRDSTHVCFYSQATMTWVARAFGWSVAFPAANISVLSRP